MKHNRQQGAESSVGVLTEQTKAIKPSRAVGITAVAIILVMSVTGVPFELRDDDKNHQYDFDDLKLVPPDEVPKHGTFWRLQRETAPLPFNPFTLVHTNVHVDVYALPKGGFLIDDWDVDYSLLESSSGARMFEGDGPEPESVVRNSEKFMAQAFSLLDTNAIALTDTNLYNALLLFPDDTNAWPTLQIMAYQTNTVLIRANHFDYSAETERDFALLICDKVETPLWKTIDFFGASDGEDGWLVQGTVPNSKVDDPMYFKVSNLDPNFNGFFRAIPYGGPQIQIAGAQPYDVVSNTVTLQTTITDLSGVTNVQLEVNVDGTPARYTLGANNTINIETKYNPNGWANVYVKAFNSAQVYDSANPPGDTKLFFTGMTSLPLDFENDTYLLWASDYCSTEVVTNYVYYVINQPEAITGSVFDPSDGRVVKSFGGYVPNPATISVSWNFTEADGTTAYSNDTYAVTFETATTGLTITNKIDRQSVRTPGGCFLTYQWEDPGDPTGTGSWLNSQAETWIRGTLAQLYNDLYKPLSLTQYTPGVVGANRNHGGCVPRDAWSISWEHIMSNYGLNNTNFSDLTFGPAHGSGAAIGGGPDDYLPGTFTPADLKLWCMSIASGTTNKNWRLRKAALWTCYSGSVALATGGFYATAWPDACGIRPNQENSLMRKNCGFFISGKVDQAWMTEGEIISTARAAEFLDQAWVCGQYQWPGACDPTYSFHWAVRATMGMYPEMNPKDQALPTIFGYSKLIYSSIYDDELMMLDTTHVKEN